MLCIQTQQNPIAPAAEHAGNCTAATIDDQMQRRTRGFADLADVLPAQVHQAIISSVGSAANGVTISQIVSNRPDGELIRLCKPHGGIAKVLSGLAELESHTVGKKTLYFLASQNQRVRNSAQVERRREGADKTSAASRIEPVEVSNPTRPTQNTSSSTPGAPPEGRAEGAPLVACHSDSLNSIRFAESN